MKIQAEHYDYLRDLMQSAIEKTPDFEIFHRLLGNSPERARWDKLWETKLIIGDEVGIGPREGRPFLPLYSYMHDEHIDTALRSICKELGHTYAASGKGSVFPELSAEEIPRFLSGGNAVAKMTHRDSGAEHLCVIGARGQVMVPKALQSHLKSNIASCAVLDADGDLHTMNLDEFGRPSIDRYEFDVGNAVYTVGLQTAFYDQETIDEGGEPNYSELQTVDMSQNELAWHCRNVGISAFSDDTLYSTDAEVGGRNFFENGIVEVRCARVIAINGDQPLKEEVHELGKNLKLSAGEVMDEAPKPVYPGLR